jgi:ATP-dependent exoDNAse (exonuclease V) alpha subunit
MAIKKAGKNVLTFIKGPPGCGKTKTIARLCKLMLEQKQQVMVGTVSNTGNLSILKELIAECVDQYRIDLINHIENIRHDPNYQREL